MKRDPDLIRQLLLEAERQEEPFETDGLAFEGSDPAHIAYHAALLADAGFIEGADASTMGRPNFIVRRMTSEGHDFLETIRDSATWQAICERLDAAGGFPPRPGQRGRLAEGVWSLLKRAWYGSHHHYTRHYTPLYVAEACYNNHRKDDNTFGSFIRGCFA